MHINKVFRSLLFLLALPLTGCLQAEVYGPLAGAEIRITELRSGADVGGDMSTDTVAESEARYGNGIWQSLGSYLQLVLMGAADTPDMAFESDQLYLVTVSGGEDLDHNNDQSLDAASTPIQGSLHAIVSGAHLSLPLVRINLLTEAVYRALLPDFNAYTDAELLAEMDAAAKLMLPDINGDQGIDYKDVLNWSNIANAARYRGDSVWPERLAFNLRYGLDEELLFYVGSDVVFRAPWTPAKPDTQYAEQLAECLLPSLYRDLCSFSEFPLIGQETLVPDVPAIMDRVVVSHPWMTARLEQVLPMMPPDILLLMRSLRAITVGANTRPSFYDANSGSIHLDANVLWVTEEERLTISTDPDYRAEFAKLVDFADLWRYVKDNDYADAAAGGIDVNGNRSIDGVAMQVAELLFHELAHAVDFLPPAIFTSLDPSLSPAETSFEIPSDRLSSNKPLQSPELFGIASVLYQGAPVSPEEAAYTADQIGGWFAADGANDLYAYSSQYEDLAMLFEEMMMYVHYGLDRDVAFTTVPAEDDVDISCADYVVAWGVRNRIGAPQVIPRLQQTLDEILPDRDFSAEIADLPAPKEMNIGLDWCDNLDLGVGGAIRRAGPGYNYSGNGYSGSGINTRQRNHAVVGRRVR